MKRIIAICVLLLSFLGSAEAVSLITGKWELPGKSVHFYEVKDGQLEEKARYVLGEDKQFGFALYLESEGYYVVGTENPRLSNWKYMFYLKPGDNLQATFADNSYQLVGKNTAENKQMKEWMDIIQPLALNALNRQKSLKDDFASVFASLQQIVKTNKEKKFSKTGNKAFDASFPLFRTYDIATNALQYKFSAKTTHPSESDYPEFYKELTLKSLTQSDELMRYPFGNRLLNHLDTQATLAKMKEDSNLKPLSPEMVNLHLAEVQNEVLKGEMLLLYVQAARSVDGVLFYKEKHENLLVTDSQMERFKQVLNEKAKNAKGDVAIDFKFPDANGKEVALSDLKGKVVYVDVWATWCGPCKQEIPHLKKLEEEYKGKNIVFLGVSTDRQRDHETWKKFLIDHELKGIQLFAGDKSRDITGPYKIQGIPRFLLIGADGRMISDNAPRPSSGEVKLVLDNALKK